jgi:hypothetical protein
MLHVMYACDRFSSTSGGHIRTNFNFYVRLLDTARHAHTAIAIAADADCQLLTADWIKEIKKIEYRIKIK